MSQNSKFIKRLSAEIVLMPRGLAPRLFTGYVTIETRNKKYKTFYVDKRPICYINQTKDYVDVVFWNAVRFTKFTELLFADKRKRMKSLRYKSLGDIDDVVIIEVHKQAYHFRAFKFLT